MSGAAEAEALKAQANAAYGRGKYAAAVGLYTDALLALGRAPPAPLVPLLSTLHSNRALAHQKLGDWGAVEADAAAAVAADRFNAKGHYLLGLAHLQARRWERGLDALKKGLDKAARKDGSSGKDTMVREFEAAIARGRAATAAAGAAAARAADDELHAFLQAAVRAAHGAGALPPSPPPPGAADGRDGGGVPPAVGGDVVVARLAQLRALFAERDAARGGARPRGSDGSEDDEVPEHLQCPITFEAMTEPVVTPSGTSYQRSAIEAYVDRRGEDPLSRQTLTRAQLVPNHGLRAAVDAYLASHPWAHPAVPYTSSVYEELHPSACSGSSASQGDDDGAGER